MFVKINILLWLDLHFHVWPLVKSLIFSLKLETAQSVKCLLRKSEALSSAPRTHMKAGMVAHRDPWGLLTGQPSLLPGLRPVRDAV